VESGLSIHPSVHVRSMVLGPGRTGRVDSRRQGSECVTIVELSGPVCLEHLHRRIFTGVSYSCRQDRRIAVWEVSVVYPLFWGHCSHTSVSQTVAPFFFLFTIFWNNISITFYSYNHTNRIKLFIQKIKQIVLKLFIQIYNQSNK
jgi:hypothetical protein